MLSQDFPCYPGISNAFPGYPKPSRDFPCLHGISHAFPIFSSFWRNLVSNFPFEISKGVSFCGGEKNIMHIALALDLNFFKSNFQNLAQAPGPSVQVCNTEGKLCRAKGFRAHATFSIGEKTSCILHSLGPIYVNFFLSLLGSL